MSTRSRYALNGTASSRTTAMSRRTLGKRENFNYALAPRRNADARQKAVFESWLEAKWKTEKKK